MCVCWCGRVACQVPANVTELKSPIFTMESSFNELSLSEKNHYYSPWRNDARPIRGLLHAIYVFTGIFDFYHHLLCGSAQINSEEKTFIIFRYSQLYYELALAFYQLEKAPLELTPLGERFISMLKDIYKASFSSYISPTCPTSIQLHIKNWKEKNVSHTLYSHSDLFSTECCHV